MNLFEIVSSATVLFLIMDPLGNIPLFMSVMKHVPPERRLKVTLRELLIALVALIVYLIAGRYLLEFLSLSQEAITISGGVILFIIALRMIFPTENGIFGDRVDEEPLIVPLAIPAVAGPSVMAVLMLMSTTNGTLHMVGAIGLAWFATAAILLTATPLHRLLGRRGLAAIERLMGMLLIMMSVQMMLNALASLNISST